MTRSLLAVVAGVIAWFLIATVVNLVFRLVYPGYAEVEASMHFSLGMMAARLLLGVGASLGAGSIAAWLGRRSSTPAIVLALLLLLLFIPVHYQLWDKFPSWYHLTFLASLLPCCFAGAKLVISGSSQSHSSTSAG